MFYSFASVLIGYTAEGNCKNKCLNQSGNSRNEANRLDFRYIVVAESTVCSLNWNLVAEGGGSKNDSWASSLRAEIRDYSPDTSPAVSFYVSRAGLPAVPT